MVLLDVNVLVYAHRAEAEDHARYRSWLEALIAGPRPFAIPDLVLSGFVRVVTHPRVFKTITPLTSALAFVDDLRSQPNFVPVAPGVRHWGIFVDLCRRADAKGNLVPDAYLAALAIESGSDWITTDRGFARFPGLSFRQPLD